MAWSLILNQGFLISLITTGVTLAIPVLIATLGEVITESSGTINLGLEGGLVLSAMAAFAASAAMPMGGWALSGATPFSVNCPPPIRMGVESSMAFPSVVPVPLPDTSLTVGWKDAVV